MAVTYCPEGLQVLQYYYGLHGIYLIGGTDAATEDTWVFPDGEKSVSYFLCEYLQGSMNAFYIYFQGPPCIQMILGQTGNHPSQMQGLMLTVCMLI